MEIKTVNIIESAANIPTKVYSFINNVEGKLEAEKLFKDILRSLFYNDEEIKYYLKRRYVKTEDLSVCIIPSE